MPWDYIAVIAVAAVAVWYRYTLSSEEKLEEEDANKDMWIW